MIKPKLSEMLRFCSSEFCVIDLVTGKRIECDIDEINDGFTPIPDDWMDKELYSIEARDESSFVLWVK